jgi:PAS domain S-box-containing protein
LFCVDRSQRILQWSQSAEQVIGLSAESVIGRPCYEVLGANQPATHPHCQPNCQVLANAQRRRPTRDFDVHLRSEEDDKWLNVSILLAEAEGPQSPLLIHLVRDVTKQRAVDCLSTAVAEDERSLDDPAPSKDDGVHPLSRRERQVIQLLAHGYKSAAIAEALGLSPITVRNHVTRAMSKLGTTSRLEAVVRSAKLGLI